MRRNEGIAPCSLQADSPRMASMFDRWKEYARHMKAEIHALYLAYRDPRVPWYVKLFVAFVVAHTLSPIDLIPDFIPVLGYLDDLIITPLGLYLALRMIPPQVMADARERAALSPPQWRIGGRVGVAIVLGVWAIALLVLAIMAYRFLKH